MEEGPELETRTGGSPDRRFAIPITDADDSILLDPRLCHLGSLSWSPAPISMGPERGRPADEGGVPTLLYVTVHVFKCRQDLT